LSRRSQCLTVAIPRWRRWRIVPSWLLNMDNCRIDSLLGYLLKLKKMWFPIAKLIPEGSWFWAWLPKHLQPFPSCFELFEPYWTSLKRELHTLPGYWQPTHPELSWPSALNRWWHPPSC
jgi:hypothetical protein